MKRVAYLLGAVALLMSVALPSAHALTSVGLSVNCDSDGHCVSGTAFSTNGGVDISGIVASEVGAAIAVCTGKGFPGATIIEITCSIGDRSETMSFPGSAGAVPLVTTTGALERLPVCWDVTGIFPVITGPPHEVSTGDCALLSV